MNLRALPLPLLSGLAIAGGALGILLGNSAISEIDPIFYNEPETRFHADLAPYRSPASAQTASVLGGETVLAPGELGDGCAGCRDYPVEYVPGYEPAIDGYAASAWEPVEDAPAQYGLDEAGAEAEADPRLAAVEIYSRYRVSADEPERAPPPAAAAARAEAAPEGEPAALGM